MNTDTSKIDVGTAPERRQYENVKAKMLETLDKQFGNLDCYEPVICMKCAWTADASDFNQPTGGDDYFCCCPNCHNTDEDSIVDMTPDAITRDMWQAAKTEESVKIDTSNAPDGWGYYNPHRNMPHWYRLINGSVYFTHPLNSESWSRSDCYSEIPPEFIARSEIEGKDAELSEDAVQRCYDALYNADGQDAYEDEHKALIRSHWKILTGRTDSEAVQSALKEPKQEWENGVPPIGWHGEVTWGTKTDWLECVVLPGKRVARQKFSSYEWALNDLGELHDAEFRPIDPHSYWD